MSSLKSLFDKICRRCGKPYQSTCEDSRLCKDCRTRWCLKRIPISAAARIAKDYGYDQVIIYARKVGDAPAPHGEHMTTYGVDKTHCAVAARIGDFLKHKILGWVKGGWS